jgi:glycosyltransferase involved in cell wall biosynthesis
MSKQRFLFIHQNFPGQFVHVAAELARQGHEVVALGIKGRPLPGVRFLRYQPKPPERPSAVPPAIDFETKVVRGLACGNAMVKLKKEGFEPDVIVAHPGWGEALFAKDVWPLSRLVVFAEFFYNAEGTDYSFDPEFTHDTLAARARLRIKNSVHLHAFHAADAIYSPTQWQASQIPAEYRHKVNVIFDGIDTSLVKPDPSAIITLGRNKLRLTPQDEVLTFVNRNLEPYRGFHVFMRALPAILHRRPQARAIIVGRDEVSYGSQHPSGKTWREVMLAEVGAQLPLDRVHFVGALAYPDYLRMLQVSRCHVYLTYPFVLGWSCLEAMAAGKTLVASSTAPVREVAEHGQNALLFDFFDQAALADLACQVLERPAEYAHLGQAARQKVVAEYDLKTVCLPRLLKLVTS